MDFVNIFLPQLSDNLTITIVYYNYQTITQFVTILSLKM